MIDRPGPWGTGPFTLTEGYSSISTRAAIMRAEPFAAAWLIESEDRSPELVLEANLDHWNRVERGPRLSKVVFRNDLPHARALELCMGAEGEVDIVSEVSPADAAAVETSEHAKLVVCDANRVLTGILNRYEGQPLADRRRRQALNLAVSQERVVDEGLGGYANLMSGLTPDWCSGITKGQKPYPRDPERARALLAEAGGWPGDVVRIATAEAFEGIARIVADEIATALDLDTRVIVVPGDAMLAGARALIEKKLTPGWDILIHAWFDLSSEAPPAVVHREFVGSDGAFRAGPEDPEFNALYAEMVAQTDPGALVGVAERIDKHVFDEAQVLFLCAPKALYAVNDHVTFGPYRTTFELAETEVDEDHWSRRNGG